jgi:hypothetical protein
MQVVTDGDALTMDSNIAVSLRNIQSTLSATLPKVNKLTRCPGKPSATDIEVTFSRINISSDNFFNPTIGLRIGGDISTRYCKANLALGQSTFSVPLSVDLKMHSPSSPTIVVTAGSVQLMPSGWSVVSAVYAVGGKQFVESQVNNAIAKKVQELNKSLKAVTITFDNQQMLQAFNPKIELTRVGLDGDDLTINLHLTGHLPGGAVSAWLENRNGKMTALKSRGRKATRARSEAGV